MKKYSWTANVDYVDGYLRYGHFEGKMTEKEFQEYSSFSDEKAPEFLIETGKLIIDDYRVNDYGKLSNPKFSVIEK